MSTDPRDVVRLLEQLPVAERAEVEDFAHFLLAKGGAGVTVAAPVGEIIRHTPGVVGGDARVRNTRIPVWTLVELKKQGRTEQQLLGDFPGLTQADLDAVWAYYRDNTAEIEDAIAAEARED